MGALPRLSRIRATAIAEAISLFEHALALDPLSVEAQTGLAGVLVARVLDLMSDSASIDLVRANGLIGQVLAASPRLARAHLIRGRVLHAQSRWEEAISEFETALTLNRNLVWALHHLALSKLYAGSIDEVIPLEEKAIRLSPREPRIGWWYYVIGTVHLLQSRVDESIVWFEKARNDIPAAPTIHGRLASAYALRGETERAVAELAEARMHVGGDLFASIAKLKAGAGWGAPKTRTLFEATYFAGLRKAGVPEK